MNAVYGGVSDTDPPAGPNFGAVEENSPGGANSWTAPLESVFEQTELRAYMAENYRADVRVAEDCELLATVADSARFAGVASRLYKKGLVESRVLTRMWWTMALRSKYPCHVPLTRAVVNGICGAVETKFWTRPCHGVVDTAQWGRMLRLERVPPKEVLLGLWPRKPHPLAGRKANVFLDCALRDLFKYATGIGDTTVEWAGRMLDQGVTEDQMTSIVVYVFSTMRDLQPRTSFALASWAILNPKASKALSDLLKGLGANMFPLGRILVELNCLVGRGVGGIDLYSDAVRRVEGSFACPVVRTDPEALRVAVRAVLERELGSRRPRLKEPDDFFNSRYKWCVAGSHNLTTNNHWLSKTDLPRLRNVNGWTRRAAMACLKENPLRTWSGRVHVSVAEKIEHGKGRAIYSCDTLSYMAFSWLLEAVEECWASRSVILSPGDDGALGMTKRIRDAAARYKRPCYVMMDYSDFNSQHSNESMRIVIEETLRLCEVSDALLAEKLVRSVDDMWIWYQGANLGRVAGSLMSGHRATTYWNSILNAAYVRLALGEHEYNASVPFHVGDDVLIVTNGPAQAWPLIEKVEALGCVLQKSKQSVGTCGFEFLRMAGDPRVGVGGYLARSIAGLVSGNWVSEHRLAPREGLHSLVHQARSLINRAQNPHAYRVLLSSSVHITKIARHYLEEFLSGAVAVAPGPCYRNDGRYVARHITWVDPVDRTVRPKIGGVGLESLPNYAAVDYVEKGCSAVERLGLQLTGTVPWRAMALTCYGAMEPSLSQASSQSIVPTQISTRTVRLKTNVVRASDITTTEAKHGLLTQYPLLALQRNYFSTSELRLLLSAVGFHNSQNPKVDAWGAGNEGVTVNGYIPYSDAAGFGSRIISAAVDADIPVAM